MWCLTEWWHEIWCHGLKWSKDMLSRHLNSTTKCMRMIWSLTRSYLSAYSLHVSLAPLEQDKHIHHQTTGDGLETDFQVGNAIMFMSPACLCKPTVLKEGNNPCSCCQGRIWIRDFFRKCLSMYSRCGSVKHACNVFDKLPRRDVFFWTAMICAFPSMA